MGGGGGALLLICAVYEQKNVVHSLFNQTNAHKNATAIERSREFACLFMTWKFLLWVYFNIQIRKKIQVSTWLLSRVLAYF